METQEDPGGLRLLLLEFLVLQSPSVPHPHLLAIPTTSCACQKAKAEKKRRQQHFPFVLAILESTKHVLPLSGWSFVSPLHGEQNS